MNIFPVILSGGSGTRLWPLSRAGYPKQFLDLFDGLSLFQMTLKRLSNLKDCDFPMVICNESHRFIIRDQANEVNMTPSSILLEPIARNTAPAIALAALKLIHDGKPDALMLVLPSDHIIKDEKAFRHACEKAAILANDNELVTFGIKALHPETGYGYIKIRDAMEHGFKIDQFVEKPDQKTAERYVSEGNYFWNSGMFMFKASQIMSELETFQPKIIEAVKKAFELAKPDLDFIRVDAASFEASPSLSIDYAVMEKTKHAAMVPLDAGWNDVGAWSSLWELHKKDGEGNAGHGDFIALNAKNNYVHADKRLVTLLGVDDLVVVETADTVMVAHKDRAQEVKTLVDQLKKDDRTETDAHKKIFRPWGFFDEVDRGDRFQVKRITVKPHQKISLQLHRKRAEHWVVVAGEAHVQIGDSIKVLSRDESIFIPRETIHSVENKGEVNLEIIEIQTGSYLGEDDIERLEDRFGRS